MHLVNIPVHIYRTSSFQQNYTKSAIRRNTIDCSFEITRFCYHIFFRDAFRATARVLAFLVEDRWWRGSKKRVLFS